MTSITEAGRRLGDLNAKRVPFANVQASDIVLAAVKTLDEEKQRDCSVIASFCRAQISSSLNFKDFPVSENLENNINSFDLLNRHFQVESPTSFLVALYLETSC